MIFKILISLFLSFNALSFDKDFTTVNDRVPLEFQHLFNSMKISVKSNSEKLKLTGICKDLDENLGLLGKEQIYFLMKSEVIKNVLEYKHEKVRSFDLTTFLIRRLEENFKLKERFLTPFSQWIWRSIIAELKFRESKGLIANQAIDLNTLIGENKIEALRFKRYLNYLLPWIDKMDSLEAEEFNDLVKEVSWITLKRLNQRSLFFKQFASTGVTDVKISLFNIPSRLLELETTDIKRIKNDEQPLTLSEESEKEKVDASKQIQDLSPDDLSPLSDEVAKELEEKAP